MTSFLHDPCRSAHRCDWEKNNDNISQTISFLLLLLLLFIYFYSQNDD